MDLGHHIGGPAQDTGAAPQVEILTNQRADTVGTQLATGILEPALAVASHLIGLLLFVYAGLTRGTLAAALGLLLWLVLRTAVVR